MDRNFVANVMDGAFFSFGLSFVSQLTVLPLLVRTIGGGNIAVGLIPVVWTLGFNLPQFLMAGRAERPGRTKPLLLKTAIGQRIPWLLLAAAAFALFGRVDAWVGLSLFFLLYGLAAVGGSLNLPVWFDLIAKLTPVTRRGRLFGIRTVTGSILGILGGAVAAAVLGTTAEPSGFALLLLLAFCSMGISYVFLTVLKEEEEPQRRNRETVRPRRSTRDLLRGNRNLRNFIVADALLISSGMGLAFLTVAAMERFALPPSAAGTFTVVIMSSTIVAGFLFGMIGDRYGHRMNLCAAAAATSCAGIAALWAPTPEIFGAAFVCAGVATTCAQISRLPFLAELAAEGERPSVIALVNLITSPFVLWGAIGGVVADAAGLTTVFLFMIGFACAAAIWLILVVREPRTQPFGSPKGEIHYA